jgi:hypothetical protein
MPGHSGDQPRQRPHQHDFLGQTEKWRGKRKRQINMGDFIEPIILAKMAILSGYSSLISLIRFNMNYVEIKYIRSFWEIAPWFWRCLANKKGQMLTFMNLAAASTAQRDIKFYAKRIGF